MRVLVTAGPAHGHVFPMLPLAGAAQRAGHEVVIATGPDLVGPVEERGFTVWPVGPSWAEAEAMRRESYAGLPADPSPRERLRAAAAGLFGAPAARRAAELVPRAGEWGPGLVVHEVSEMAGAIVAARTGARHAVHGVTLMPPEHVDALMWAFAPLCREWDVPELADGILDRTYLDICPPGLRPPGHPGWRHVQPVRPAGGAPRPGERLPDALDDLPYPETIHLTLGTLYNTKPGVLETALAGLRDLPLNVVVTTGPGSDPGRLGSQPPHVLVAPLIPHELLLPRCRLVVSQGGAGVMLGALAHGLPQLILPQGADQPLNAAACQATGAGLALTPDAVTAEAVRASAERLLAEPAFTDAARRIRAEIDAMPAAAEVLDTLIAPG
jgi:UDP:flavonoid glycosyltransferase YjiC (YdhE family)